VSIPAINGGATDLYELTSVDGAHWYGVAHQAMA
jgi:hypothetical protein